MASWWDGAEDFLDGVATTAGKVNTIAGTVSDFGKGNVQIAYENAQVKALAEQQKVNYNSQLLGVTATSGTTAGIDNKTLLIGGAILGAILLLK